MKKPPSTGTEHARRAEDRAEVAAVAAALARRDDVAHGGQRQGEQAAAAEPLDGAEGDQLADVLGGPDISEPTRKVMIAAWKISLRP